MFKVYERPEFTRTVTIQVPDGDGVSEEQFHASFRWLPSDELEDFDTGTTAGIKDLLRAIVVNCSGIADDDDQELPWSDELREALLGWSNARTALLLSYNRAWTEEKRGN